VIFTSALYSEMAATKTFKEFEEMPGEYNFRVTNHTSLIFAYVKS
jgi:hypothetical protein